MAPPGRRGALSSGALDEAFYNFETLAAADRALAGQIFRGVLQNLRLIDWMLDHSTTFDRERTAESAIWILRMAVYQKAFLGGVPDYAIGQQAAEHARQAAGESSSGFVNAMIRAMLPVLPDAPEKIDAWLAERHPEGPPPPALRWSVPDDIAAELAEVYGADTMNDLLRGMSVRETRVWIRANATKTTRAELARRLSAEGVATEPARWDDWTLLWRPRELSGRPPWETECWDRGECTVQDLGAMAGVWMLAPKPGESVLDWCAAPGGKTGQMWEMMGGRGSLIAYEIDLRRRETMRRALERLYGEFHNIHLPGKATEIGRHVVTPRKLCHAVLVDAPCLALGLIRRHPEIRWDGRLADMEATTETQSRILESASAWVAPGGRLAWVTCSPTRRENEGIILPFLEAHPEFDLVDPAPLVPEAAREWIQTDGRFARTRPDRAPVDGFAVAVIKRKTG